VTTIRTDGRVDDTVPTARLHGRRRGRRVARRLDTMRRQECDAHDPLLGQMRRPDDRRSWAPSVLDYHVGGGGA